MGVCCAAREGNREIDLPKPEIKGNAFQQFELSFPFSQTYADTFAKRVRAAASALELEKKGDGSTVTIEALRKVFKTPAWADINKEAEESRITKLIQSKVFRAKNGGIDADKLILFGFLNCPGDVRHKSQVLYGVMQEGGVEKQQFLSAGDKDIQPTIQLLMSLCTIDLVKLMAEVD